MKPIEFEGMTRKLGESQGYIGLPVQDYTTDEGQRQMMSIWQPTPEDIVHLMSGKAVIMLSVLGPEHPPIKLAVGELE